MKATEVRESVADRIGFFVIDALVDSLILACIISVIAYESF